MTVRCLTDGPATGRQSFDDVLREAEARRLAESVAHAEHVGDLVALWTPRGIFLAGVAVGFALGRWRR